MGRLVVIAGPSCVGKSPLHVRDVMRRKLLRRTQKQKNRGIPLLPCCDMGSVGAINSPEWTSCVRPRGLASAGFSPAER